jgi:hypothetical protein
LRDTSEVRLDTNPAEEIARHVAKAQYVKDCGGLCLQLIDKLQSYPRRTSAEVISNKRSVLSFEPPRSAPPKQVASGV